MIAGLYNIFDHWSKRGAVWIYSDPHFSDKELAAGVARRPSDEDQLKLINSKVGKNDTFICLGDCGNIEYIRKIKGYKVLIMGNHDAGKTNYIRQKITKKFDNDKYSKEEALQAMREQYPNWKLTLEEGYDMCHSPFTFWEVTADNRLFDEAYEGPVQIAEKLILSHEPLAINWAFNIHGHDHTGRLNDLYHYNVCSDVIGYVPINFNQWMKQGYLSKIDTMHRSVINKATIRAKKRDKKNGK